MKNIAALALLGMGMALASTNAHAGAHCSISVPSDLNRPHEYTKTIYQGSVLSGSANDGHRSRFVKVKKDLSAATEITGADFDKMVADQDFKTLDGDSLVTFSKQNGSYVVAIVAIDSSRKFEDMIWDVLATGPLAKNIWLSASSFRHQLAVICSLDR